MPTPSVAGGQIAEAISSGLLRTNNPNAILWQAYVAIGASGAPTVSQNGGGTGPITLTRTGAGTYTGTFPIMAASTTSIAYVEVGVALSAAITVAKAVVTAFSPTAGTFGFTVSLNTAGTAVDPANGDALFVRVYGAHTGQF